MDVKKSLIFVLAVFLGIIVLGVPSAASVFFAKDRYFVAAGDTINDDLYVGTGEGLFDGVITGDLIVGARKYIISGDVLGNINAASQIATLRGSVNNSVRIFAQTLTIDGPIGGNLLAFASDVDISRDCRIGKDATIFGGEISIAGEVGRNVHVRCNQVIISGKVGGDVNIKAEKISIVAPAEITGNIVYTSSKEIRIEEGAVVNGTIDWKKTKEQGKGGEGGIDWVTRIILFLAALATGLILIGVTGRHARLAADYVVRKPLVSLGIGFVAFCVTPIAILVLLILVVGIPAGIILLFTYTVFFYIAKIYVAIAFGRFGIRMLRKDAEPRQGWSLLLGLIVLTILFVVPVIKWVAYLGVVFWGMGAILLAIRDCRVASQPAGNAAPAIPAPPSS
jgi:cytoskeletal protein CcmA (bactofilin family)